MKGNQLSSNQDQPMMYTQRFQNIGGADIGCPKGKN